MEVGRREAEEARGQGRHELHVCAAFLCLSSRDSHDLGGSTSARSEKSDGGWNWRSKSRRCSERAGARIASSANAAVTARRDASQRETSVDGR